MKVSKQIYEIKKALKSEIDNKVHYQSRERTNRFSIREMENSFAKTRY